MGMDDAKKDIGGHISYTPRRRWLLAKDLGKSVLQGFPKLTVLRSLVKLADKVPVWLQRLERKRQRGMAKILRVSE
jgi:hypothetical protein